MKYKPPTSEEQARSRYRNIRTLRHAAELLQLCYSAPDLATEIAVIATALDKSIRQSKKVSQ